jgi:MoaA/NifB/PqqE/SkfB family radical SAM enzyme
MGRSIAESIKAQVLSVILQSLDRLPGSSVEKLIHMTENLPLPGAMGERLEVIRDAMKGPSGHYHLPEKAFWQEIDPSIRKKLFSNFMIHATAIGAIRQKRKEKTLHCNVPWAILMDPTSACDQRCAGCWAAEYGSELSMDYETLDSIILQGKELGVHVYVYSGGEPLLRQDDLIQLATIHSDCVFLAFTNASSIDEDFTDALLNVKNFVLALSVEGFQHETDQRRGPGSYQTMTNAMKLLRKKRLLFGFSTCYTSQNIDIVSSEEYLNKMIQLGCKFGWFFTYIPIGAGAIPELMVTAEQRRQMFNQLRKFRYTKPLLTFDFWNDAEFVGGCVAGGRRYLHINANGDIEPCAFVHYSDANIHTHTLSEALRSPLFREFNIHQPFNQNHLRACPLLDNPDSLVHMVNTSGAKSTEVIHSEQVEVLREKVLPTAMRWSDIADEIWTSRTHKT